MGGSKLSDRLFDNSSNISLRIYRKKLGFRKQRTSDLESSCNPRLRWCSSSPHSRSIFLNQRWRKQVRSYCICYLFSFSLRIFTFLVNQSPPTEVKTECGQRAVCEKRDTYLDMSQMALKLLPSSIERCDCLVELVLSRNYLRWGFSPVWVTQDNIARIKHGKWAFLRCV